MSEGSHCSLLTRSILPWCYWQRTTDSPGKKVLEYSSLDLGVWPKNYRQRIQFYLLAPLFQTFRFPKQAEQILTLSCEVSVCVTVWYASQLEAEDISTPLWYSLKSTKTIGYTNLAPEAKLDKRQVNWTETVNRKNDDGSQENQDCCHSSLHASEDEAAQVVSTPQRHKHEVFCHTRSQEVWITKYTVRGDSRNNETKGTCNYICKVQFLFASPSLIQFNWLLFFDS